MSEIMNLSRASLLDHKRDGLSDAAIAALYDSAPQQIAALRHQFEVPALACDLSLASPASRSRAGPERGKKRRPNGRGNISEDIAWDTAMRTTDEAEAHLTAFFATHPNFAADNVRIRPQRRMAAGVASVVGCGASALHGA